MIANRYRETNGNPTWEIKQGSKGLLKRDLESERPEGISASYTHNITEMKLPENGVTNCELFQTRNSILERDYLKFSALCLLFSLLYSGFIAFFSFSFFFFKIPFIFHHSVHVYNEIPYLSLFSPNTPLLSSCFHVFYLYLIMQQAGLVESFPLCCDLS